MKIWKKTWEKRNTLPTLVGNKVSAFDFIGSKKVKKRHYTLDQIITCNVIISVSFYFTSTSVYHALIWQNSHGTNILFTGDSSNTVKNPLKRKITLIIAIYSKYRDRHESPAAAFSRLFHAMRFLSNLLLSLDWQCLLHQKLRRTLIA